MNRARSPRSALQRLTSAANGRRSRGPTSPLGRAIASRNATRHGLSALASIDVNESIEQYREDIEPVMSMLLGKSSSCGLARFAHHVADVLQRREKLSRFEQGLIAAATEKKLKATEAFKKLVLATNAIAAAQGLASLCESVPSSISTERVQGLVRPMGTVRDMVAEADVPGTILGPLGVAIEVFVLDSIIEVTPENFLAVASACRDAERDLALRIPALQREVEVERERIGMNPMLLEPRDMRLVDRHRARLAKELEQAMAAFRMARDLAEHEPPSSGSFVEQEQLIQVNVVSRRASR
jgi:hypothetical protein